LPGSTGMPKWMTLPPAARCRRHHVVAIDDRRGAGDQEDVAAFGLQLLRAPGDGGRSWRSAARRSACCRAR
jgi:hypothetical protein